MQNTEGQFSTSTHALMYEGHMLIYDPHRNISEWVPMRGIFVLLTSVELRSANNLNNTDSWNEPSDSEEWNKLECGDWSHCPTQPMGEEGLTWEEFTTGPPQSKVITEKEDSDRDAETHTVAGSQSGEVSSPACQVKRCLWKWQNPWQNYAWWCINWPINWSISRAGKSGQGPDPCGEWWPRLGIYLHAKQTNEDRAEEEDSLIHGKINVHSKLLILNLVHLWACANIVLYFYFMFW